MRLDCDGSATFSVEDSSPPEACWVCRLNAANPANNNGESPGTSGTSPSADGARPTADNTVDDSGVSTDSGSETTGGSSSDVFAVDVVTSTTDTSLVVGEADTGSGFGCSATLVAAADSLVLTSVSEGVLTTARFGAFFFGVDAEKSEPDFLSFTVDPVDFLLSWLSSPDEAPSSASGSPASTFDSPAPPPPDAPDDEPSFELDPSFGSDEDDVESEEVVEVVESESEGPAHATPGAVATATPTPNATAKPPTRPTYLAYPMTTPSESGRAKRAANPAIASSTERTRRD
jgi:hypothetical protein